MTLVKQSREPMSRTLTTGYRVGGLGALAYVISTFLPFYSFQFASSISDTGGHGVSFYSDITNFMGHLVVPKVGGYLFLYAGPVFILVLAIQGLRRGGMYPSLPALFAGATLAWGVSAIGLLLNQSKSGVGHGSATSACSSESA